MHQGGLVKFFVSPNSWKNPQNLRALSYECGFCSNQVSSEKGLHSYDPNNGYVNSFIYLCPSCDGPTFIAPNKEQFPSPIFGKEVSNVPDDLAQLYNEARRCTGHNCFTSSVLTCRKILMNIAVEQGANAGLRFIEYVNFLGDKGYIPPNGRHWVDHIRKKGNEATHEIELMDSTDAQELIIFVEMLLRFIYEFPNMVPSDT